MVFNWKDGIVDIHDYSMSSTRDQFGRCIKTLPSTAFTVTKCLSKQVKIKVKCFFKILSNLKILA